MRSPAIIEWEAARDRGEIASERTVRLELTLPQLTLLVACVDATARSVLAAAEREWWPGKRRIGLDGATELTRLLAALRQ